jgi:hypothetical protein
LDTLSAEEFKETLDRVQGIATMRLDFESVIAYKRMNSFVADQAGKFTEVLTVVSNENEFIDPKSVTSGYENRLRKQERAEAEKEFFATHKDNLAIAVFYGGLDHLSYSHQRTAIEAFSKNYPDVEVLWVDVAASPETKTKMGLVTLPETWLAYKKDGDLIWRRLKSGAITADEIASKTLFVYEKTIEKNIFAEREDKE